MKKLLLSVAFAMCALPAVVHAQEAPKTGVDVSKLPFSPGLPIGDTVYVSGHLGVDPAVDKAPPADPEAEVRKLLDGIQATLKTSGLTMDDMVYVEVFCTDLKLYPAFNKVYSSYFSKPYPARAFIGVKDLLFGAHFEVMGLAVKNGAQQKKGTR